MPLDVSLPPELTALDPDTRDHVLELAAEIVRGGDCIEGLTRQQSRIVHVVRAARGRWVTYQAIGGAISWDRSEPTSPEVVVTQLCRMRGHSLGQCIERSGRRGPGHPAEARWVG